MPPPPHPDNMPRDEYSAAESEFILAMERYQRKTRRRFPSWHEVLGVLKSLGYRKIEEELNHRSTEAPREEKEKTKKNGTS